MIEKLRGQYVASLPKGIVIDVNGVGYGLEVPLSTHSNLPEVGQNVDLWVHTYVREDAIRLYGFQHYVDRVAFEILIGLNGVGPKVALAILSTLTVDQLRKAILLERMDLLQNVPGIDKRLAEKIFVECFRFGLDELSKYFIFSTEIIIDCCFYFSNRFCNIRQCGFLISILFE